MKQQLEKAIFAPAKVNLSLEVKGKLPDGYHEIDSVMSSVSLGDWLYFSPAEKFELVSDTGLGIPAAENLITRAVILLGERMHRTFPLRIMLQKNIPVAAGLAGGSTDVAATLHALNKMFKLGLSLPELQEIGGTLGADIPFCLKGGVCRVGGKGEKLIPFNFSGEFWLVLVTPATSVSTPLVYREFDVLSQSGYNSHTDKVLSCMTGGGKEIVKVWGNDLERATFKLFPAVKELRESISKSPEVLGAMMSGSGPTIMGMVAGEKEGKSLIAALNLPRSEYAVHLVKNIEPSFHLL